MTDDEVVAAATAMIKENPHIARTRVARTMGITIDRLERLGREGRVKLPPKMTQSMSGKMGALTNTRGWRNRANALRLKKETPTKKESS